MTGGPDIVLVVDDDPDVREVLSTMLRLEGYQVLEAADGAEALEVLGGCTPSIILLDLMMPGMDGPEFRDHQLKDPALAAIPLVVLSGGGAAARAAADLDAVAVLPKPVELRSLLETVSRCLQR